MATTTEPSPPRPPDRLEAEALGRLSDEDSLSECILGGSFLDQSAAHLEILRCRILNAELTSSQLPFLNLIDDVLENCDLSGAVLEQSTLTRVLLRDCKMSGLEFAQSSLRDVLFSGCRLDNANFRMCGFERVTFDSVDLRTAEFSGSKLVACRFFDCNLTGVDFSKARADGTRLHGSVLEDIKGAHSPRGRHRLDAGGSAWSSAAWHDGHHGRRSEGSRTTSSGKEAIE